MAAKIRRAPQAATKAAEPPADPGVRIEYMSLAAIKRWSDNPKKHDLEALRRSIERFGFVQPVTLDERTETLVAGHGRLQALTALRDGGAAPPAGVEETAQGWQVPVLRGVRFKSDTDMEAYAIADNRLEELGRWDEWTLGTVMEGLVAAGNGQAEGLGWTAEEIDRLRAVAQGDVLTYGQAETGQSPEDGRSVYETTEQRQICLIFREQEYDRVLALFRRVQEAHELPSFSAVVDKCLDGYEAAQAGAGA